MRVEVMSFEDELLGSRVMCCIRRYDAVMVGPGRMVAYGVTKWNYRSV